MSYLRLVRSNIQQLSETVASVLNVEVAVADKNLTRIAGTGKFYDKLDKNCSEDSLFAKVIKSNDPIINLDRLENCEGCSNKENCTEFANMSHPIRKDGKAIGVVSFASFDREQTQLIRLKKQEYFNMLKETSMIIEQEIKNIEIANKLEKDVADVNEIINCLNKGIIIVNCNKDILHVNSKAVELMDIDLQKDSIIGKNISDFINGIDYKETNEDEVGVWKIKEENYRVIYNINKLAIRDNEFSVMISFDFMKDIINLANTYKGKDNIKFENIIGESDAILKSINKSKKAARTDSTILITGESGTGKELFARSIHNESNRSKGPFVAINCGSIPESLIESELFGYEKGSFTGANVSGKIGKIELAHNGTLFLDEIGDLPLHLQTRLLRVLQERQIERIGATKPIDVNIRIISATNKDLLKKVKNKEFRLDLYYRLNVIPIELPPLKDRDKDVLICSDFIIKKMCKEMNIESKKLSEDVKRLFLEYPWKGNIRELENVIEHGICFSDSKYIDKEHLPDYFIHNKLENIIGENSYKDCLDINKLDGSLDDMLSKFEKDLLDKMIKEYGDTTEGKKIVAEKLKISLPTLYRKLK
ncbi:MAG TPA: sigma 54-interacting transcriptional regulator [Tissierellaceae bacterium]